MTFSSTPIDIVAEILTSAIIKANEIRDRNIRKQQLKQFVDEIATYWET